MGCLWVLIEVLGWVVIGVSAQRRRESGATTQPVETVAIVWGVGYMVALVGSAYMVIFTAPTNQGMVWGVAACIIGTSAIFLPVGVWLARRSKGRPTGSGR